MAKKTPPALRTPDTEFANFEFGGKTWKTRVGQRRPPREVAAGAAFARALNQARIFGAGENDKESEQALARLDHATRRMFRACVSDENGKPPTDDEIEGMANAGCHQDVLIAMRDPDAAEEAEKVDPTTIGLGDI